MIMWGIFKANANDIYIKLVIFYSYDQIPLS